MKPFVRKNDSAAQNPSRRQVLRWAAHSAAAMAFPGSIRRALALPAITQTRTLADVQHIVLLMQENRSFDHYFGTLRGVRGFADRHPLPLPGGKPVWMQSDGQREIPPFHLDTLTTSAMRVPGTPHTFADAQAAWGQGRLNQWPKFKTPISMGHYRREDLAFQFALAEAFTICDAHHCSITTGTDPNRIVFWSGSNCDPQRGAQGENCTHIDSEPNNLRCLVKGIFPTPGYSYQGEAFTWPTLPELLERAGISWRIYQDPNDNWTGLMHGGLAFAGFRNATPGTPLYEQGMSPWSLKQLQQHVEAGTLPQVSWILPPMLWSEHPTPSSPLQGAEFTSRVLEALTANPEVWGRTVLLISFDENDGLFDHVPPPAPPSCNPDGSLAGKATLNLAGNYFLDPKRKYLLPEDRISGTLRPWGLGPRVPLYVISPWSRGGYVSSQVFDHTSVGQLLERRFGITVPAISPWHRAVCGDLTSTLDFVHPNDVTFPDLPQVTGSADTVARLSRLPRPAPPLTPESPFQEPGVRRSRALPYALHADAHGDPTQQSLQVTFRSLGASGVVFHAYDRLHLDRIPRRYTVEAGKHLADEWDLAADGGRYDLWIYGPNGFVREFRGTLGKSHQPPPQLSLEYDVPGVAVVLVASNPARTPATLSIRSNAYHPGDPESLRVPPGGSVSWLRSVVASHQWYDLSVTTDGLEWRLTGRMETGRDSFSDPAV